MQSASKNKSPRTSPTLDSQNILTAIEEISKLAEHVFIDTECMKEMGKEVTSYLDWNLKNKCFPEISTKFTRYPYEYHPLVGENVAADWLLVLNALNFSLWYPKGTKQWSVGGGMTGYSALCYVLNRAIRQSIPMWSPVFYTELINKPELARTLFEGDDKEIEIPLLQTRLEILHKIGTLLNQKYSGSFVTCIIACQGERSRLEKLINEEFESFKDICNYDGSGKTIVVNFSQKTRTLLNDIWFYCKKISWGCHLTSDATLSSMFVDYCAPQLLIRFKLLRYSDSLKARFENDNTPLKHGSKEEVEIRACSLLAVHKLRLLMTVEMLKYLAKFEGFFMEPLHFDLALVIDNFLWDYRNIYEHELMRTVPLHFVRSTAY